jgi:predicted protein tyrosine phosphatase
MHYAPSTPSSRISLTEIIPRLFISDLAAAENSAVLSSLGITHVLSVMQGFVALPPELGLHHAQIPLDDLPFAELAAYLPVSTAFLRDALRSPTARVLVHCAEGISRSTSVVSGFLIAQYGLTPSQAVQYVKSRRRIAEPNPGFISQLYEYAEALRQAS